MGMIAKPKNILKNKVLRMFSEDIFFAMPISFAPVLCATREFVPTATISPKAKIPHTRKVATVIAASSLLPSFPTQKASIITNSDLTIVCNTAGIASANIIFLSLFKILNIEL
jgi:hypothetical protein